MNKTILILSANPSDTAVLRLDAEVREIEAGLKRAKHRDQFELKQQWATRPSDLRRAVSDIKPSIIHFCGHGDGVNGIVLENNDGNSHLISSEALAALFKMFADSLQCVVLNACYSEAQALAIAEHIPYVIGMGSAISDPAAIVFATAFYDELGAGGNFERAHEMGCIALRLENIPEHLTPVLHPKAMTNPLIKHNENEIPEGQVPLLSGFYVERQPIEQDCYQAIEKPYSLIRIKAPLQMGKTSLLSRILNHAELKQQRCVLLSFQEADSEVFSNLDNLLRWFCAATAEKLGLEDNVEQSWKKILGAKVNAGKYFEKHFLETSSLTLGLDAVDVLFQYPQLAGDFFALLRAWHEKSKNNPVWKNMRLVITHAKEVSVPLQIDQSPFNVGLPIALPEFNQAQVQDLIQRYRLKWPDEQIRLFYQMLGGHPYLVRQGLYHIALQRLSLTDFLKQAPTDQGLYGGHLRHYLKMIQQINLQEITKQVMLAAEPILIDSNLALKLTSTGLVRWYGHGPKIQPMCQLYKLYFCERL